MAAARRAAARDTEEEVAATGEEAAPGSIAEEAAPASGGRQECAYCEDVAHVRTNFVGQRGSSFSFMC